jgi:hypothetical protein
MPAVFRGGPIDGDKSGVGILDDGTLPEAFWLSMRKRRCKPRAYALYRRDGTIEDGRHVFRYVRSGTHENDPEVRQAIEEEWKEAKAAHLAKKEVRP